MLCTLHCSYQFKEKANDFKNNKLILNKDIIKATKINLIICLLWQNKCFNKIILCCFNNHKILNRWSYSNIPKFITRAILYRWTSGRVFGVEEVRFLKCTWNIVKSKQTYTISLHKKNKWHKSKLFRIFLASTWPPLQIKFGKNKKWRVGYVFLFQAPAGAISGKNLTFN